MTAIGRPLRNVQFTATPLEPRMSSSHAATIARQRAVIRAAFQPLPNALPGSGSLRPGIRSSQGGMTPRTAVVPGARPRGRIGVSSWRATEQNNIFGASTSRAVTTVIGLFLALMLLLVPSIAASTSTATMNMLHDEQIRILEQVRLGNEDTSRLGREPAVRRQAFDLGITQLTDPLVVAPQ